MIDLFPAFKVGAGLLEVKRHFVFHTLAHGIHHPGIIAEPGFIAEFTSADHLVDLFPVFLKKSFNIDRSQHRLMNDGFMADGKLQEYGEPFISHILVFTGAADVNVFIAFTPVLRKIHMKPLWPFCDKEEIQVSAGTHHCPGFFSPFIRIRMRSVRLHRFDCLPFLFSFVLMLFWITQTIRKVIENNGIECWMAPESIPMGSDYACEIPDGVNNWAMSTYESRRNLISNYVRPLIGEMQLSALNTRVMDQFYRSLQKVKPVVVNNVQPKNEFLTAHTVREIHKILRTAFNQAVKWELMPKNPVVNATLPKEEHVPRNIWTADTLFKALDVCDDDMLRLALNLAFSCSLRMGEMLALTWDCIDIAPESIESGRASIYVNKELQRVNRDAMDKLDERGVILKFPPAFASTHTRLVLKEPKTKTSVRRIFLPKTVAEMLVERRKEIDELKDLFGDEFLDFDLVFCSSNGRPIESQIINRAFNKLIKDNGFPKVVFHSLRHTSITYKLKLNGGDMKSVQGDSGHAQLKMVADVYSHIIDDDRRLNAQRFEETFYSGKAAAETDTESADTVASAAPKQETDQEALIRILKNPEMAALLKTLAQSL